MTRIEKAIDRSLSKAVSLESPSKLAAALMYATKPGGARVRPTILLSVALACGDDKPQITDSAAAALELMHCASLVHDDLPCFDDASMRRGKAAVHIEFSEPLAVLTGDSLIMLAFETLAHSSSIDPVRSAKLVLALAQMSGMPNGICAGQGWESEEDIDLAAYHRSKTGALFIAASQMGAIASGQDPEPWFELGNRIGEAFQVADDLRDALMDSSTTGKPSGQDARKGRPNAVAELGEVGATKRLKDILGSAKECIPPCPGQAMLAKVMAAEAGRFVPHNSKVMDTSPD